MMRYPLLFTCLFFAVFNASAQNTTIAATDKQVLTDSLNKDYVYSRVEQMPEASVDIVRYLQQNIVYPKRAQYDGIEGKVVVKFVINEDGSTSDFVVVRELCKACDAEAVRVIKDMPRWIPARQNGRPVKVYFTLPIVFRLR